MKQSLSRRACQASLLPPRHKRLPLFLLARAQLIFRNVHKLLVDTASSEFLFCLDFWEDEGVFKELFGPVVSVVESDLATQLQVCAHATVAQGRDAACGVLGLFSV